MSIRRCLMLSVATVMLPTFASAQGSDQSTDSATAVAAARAWLELIDDGHVAAALDSAAPLLRSMVGSQAQWQQFVTTARTGIADVSTRRIFTIERNPNLAGAPPGTYLRIGFQVAIEDGAATETVVVVRTDQGWRVAMYGVFGTKRRGMVRDA